MGKESVQTLFHRHLGQIAYNEALNLQHDVHAKVKSGELEAVILSLEHPKTLTLGKHATRDNLLLAPEQLESQGVVLCQTDRGGEVTAHNPGQLVIYPILPIASLGLSPRRYVDILCTSVIETLSQYGIESRQDEQFPGVWVGNQKICAIGVRISSRVSMHGLALNVNNALDLFTVIIPCGIRQRGVTSMQQVLSAPMDFQTVRETLVGSLAKNLGLKLQAFKSE
jgi:lipoate-protein ligase B